MFVSDLSRCFEIYERTREREREGGKNALVPNDATPANHLVHPDLPPLPTSDPLHPPNPPLRLPHDPLQPSPNTQTNAPNSLEPRALVSDQRGPLEELGLGGLEAVEG